MCGQCRLGEMHHRRMVDPSGDAGADPFGGAKQDGCTHRRCVIGTAVEYRVQRPKLERHAVLRAAQQRGIAVRMRVDQAGNEPAVAGIDMFHRTLAQRRAIDRREAYHGDAVALDQHGAFGKAGIAQHERTDGDAHRLTTSGWSSVVVKRGAAPPGAPQPVTAGPKNSALIAANCVSSGGSAWSSKMAATGQTDRHTPQSMHSSGWMYSIRPPV